MKALLLLLVAASFCSIASAKRVPVSVDRVRSFSDAVFVGRVKSVEKIGVAHFFRIHLAIDEVVFHRFRSVKPVSVDFLASSPSPARSMFRVGDSFVVSLVECKGQFISVFGEEFSAGMTKGGFKTGGWIGLDRPAKLTDLKRHLVPPLSRDQEVTSQHCARLAAVNNELLGTESAPQIERP